MRGLTVRYCLCSAILLASACWAQDPFERVLQLSKVRRKMADSLAHLPNYTCLATTYRATRKPKDRDFKLVDTVRFEIAHAGSTELWAWPGAKRFQDTPITSAVQNGAIGDGDFALHARNVFTNQFVNTKFAGAEPLNGRPTLRWTFNIPINGSGWKIGNGEQQTIAAASGSFWADQETLDVLRLEIHAEQLPVGFPIAEAVNVTNYARTKAGSSFVQLPQSAVLYIRESNKSAVRNTTEFTHCRQYVGESTISYEEKAPSEAAARPVQEVVIPPGLQVRVKLTSTIDSASAALGDLIEGKLEREIVHHGVVLIPRGATVNGRLRRLEKQANEQGFMVGIELDEITFPEHHARFFGSYAGMDPAPPEYQGFLSGSRTQTQEFNSTITTMLPSLHLPEMPGVATFFMTGAQFKISGVTLVWETLKL